jgi:DNA-binding NtrC family response regulator
VEQVMSDANTCLLIEDDEQLRTSLSEILSLEGYVVSPESTAEGAIARSEDQGFDFVISDIALPGMSGIDALGPLRDSLPDAPVILVTGHPSIESAVQGMRAGAFDYVTKPFNWSELFVVIERALEHRALQIENRTLRSRLPRGNEFAGIIGASPAMQDVMRRIERLAKSRISVLISGESGTGKEVIARAIHQTGPTGGQPFVDINCSAIPMELLETELFGHVRGAFTGADREKPGLFEAAGRGTLFLDEVGEMPAQLQAKLLRVLQNREIRRVGGTQPTAVHARVIAATNKDLRAEIQAGRFRRDLFYRLNVIPIHLPALHERPEDIPLLASHFVHKLAPDAHRQLSAGALAMLARRRWEGNARELENVIERALVLSDEPTIQAEDLPLDESDAGPQGEALEYLLIRASEDGLTVRELSDRYIAHVLHASEGNKTRAAQRLGVAVRTLYRKDAAEKPPESAA